MAPREPSKAFSKILADIEEEYSECDERGAQASVSPPLHRQSKGKGVEFSSSFLGQVEPTGKKPLSLLPLSRVPWVSDQKANPDKSSSIVVLVAKDD